MDTKTNTQIDVKKRIAQLKASLETKRDISSSRFGNVKRLYRPEAASGSL